MGGWSGGWLGTGSGFSSAMGAEALLEIKNGIAGTNVAESEELQGEKPEGELQAHPARQLLHRPSVHQH